MYAQIVKWFHNHAFLERKALGVAKGRTKKASLLPKVSCYTGDQSDDDHAISNHLAELKKESVKKKPDQDKVLRLFALTYKHRHEEMLQKNAPARVQSSIQIYPALQRPLHVSFIISSNPHILSTKSCQIINQSILIDVYLDNYCVAHILLYRLYMSSTWVKAKGLRPSWT